MTSVIEKTILKGMNFEIFDNILGCTLEKGLTIVKNEGFDFKINRYSPPRKDSEDFDLNKGRIVRVRLLNEKTVEITICDFTTPF